MLETSRKGSIPQWCGIILLKNVRYSMRVVKYSLWYSPNTQVANYSDSTALLSQWVEFYIPLNI